MAENQYYENDGTVSSSDITMTNKKLPPKVEQTNRSNPLNSFRSYNYVFTLASLRKEALVDPQSYRNAENYFVIAKSAGKGTKGLSTNVSGVDRKIGEEETVYREQGRVLARTTRDVFEKDFSGLNLVSSFNTSSPGRFDFFMNNVRIETIMGFNERTNLSVATNIEFTVIEPYSMSGFIEALQVSAVAAGYPQYTVAPYLLKMEFIGYPDGEEIPDTAVIVPESTRYFVMGFAGLDIDVTEVGATYRCKCIPFNEKGFGIAAKLKSSVKVEGNTVGDLLSSFQKGLNKTRESDTAKERDASQTSKCDTYEIIVPEIDDKGAIVGSVNRDIYDAKVAKLLQSENNWNFAIPAVDESGRANAFLDPRSLALSPTLATVVFKEDTNIHECISSIIMHSDYVKGILDKLSTPGSKVVDQYGMVKYFIINVEVEDKGIYDDKTNKPFYHYRYVVTPYKIHCTRIPLMQNQKIDPSKFIRVANRTYDYLYTGKNIDIKSFQLKFNSLFFQAIPKALGNNPNRPATSDTMENPGTPKSELVSTPKGEVETSALGIPPVKEDVQMTQVHFKSQPNIAPVDQADPYAALVRNMHNAILENVDQCQAEFEIIGDPYYLVTGGIGNYRPLLNPNGTVGEGEAPYINSDVLIVIKFKNPVDIDKETGEAIFDNKITPYSGLFRVIRVEHIFTDGLFTQKLNVIRVPGQVNFDQDAPSKPREASRAIIASTSNPATDPTERPREVVTSLRASTNSLLSSIATQLLPSTGLPGSLSKFASSVGGTLAGISAGVSAASALSQLAPSGAGSALSGLAGVSSSIRLANAGLSSLATNINSAGASITQLTDTIKSTGVNITDPTNLSNTTIAANLGNLSNLGTSAIASVKSLGQQGAGLVSGVASKIDALKGTENAIAAQLGVDTSKLSGLSSELQSKVKAQLGEISKAIPSNVDLSKAVKDGLILNNIPSSAVENIPVTQPEATAPAAIPNLSDIKAILAQGGSLKNIPGASEIPGVSALISSVNNLNLPDNFNAIANADKLAVVQKGLSSITGQSLSIEASLNKVKSIVPSGLQNVADAGTSVINKFGSISSDANSPLDILMKSKA